MTRFYHFTLFCGINTCLFSLVINFITIQIWLHLSICSYHTIRCSLYMTSNQTAKFRGFNNLETAGLLWEICCALEQKVGSIVSIWAPKFLYYFWISLVLSTGITWWWLTLAVLTKFNGLYPQHSLVFVKWILVLFLFSIMVHLKPVPETTCWYKIPLLYPHFKRCVGIPINFNLSSIHRDKHEIKGTFPLQLFEQMSAASSWLPTQLRITI